MRVFKTYLAIYAGLFFLYVVTFVSGGPNADLTKLMLPIVGYATFPLPVMIGFSFPRATFVFGAVCLVLFGLTFFFWFIGVAIFFACSIPTIYYKFYPPQQPAPQPLTR